MTLAERAWLSSTIRAFRLSSIAAAAPDPTEPKPYSRLLICLQINQQTIAG
jgi:hypothetical protein